MMAHLSQFDTIDPTFATDLLDSQNHVRRVASWLCDCGFRVEMKPMRLRPAVEQMKDYSDDGDLEVGGKGRVEVKQRKFGFSSKESYPYSSVIVDVAHAWERANPKPFAYIITNEDCTACLVVKGITFSSWTKIRKWDRSRGRDRTFLECPLRLCKFCLIK